MSNKVHTEGGDEGLQLMLRIWHPDDWMIEITEDNPCEIFVNAIYSGPDRSVQGMFTVYGESSAEVEAIIEATKESRLTDNVMKLRERYGQSGSTSYAKSSCELFVAYNTEYSINSTMVKRGFIHEDPIRIVDGWEYWPVFFPGDRAEMEEMLEELREEMDADITVTRNMSARGGGTTHSENVLRGDRLSKRQREVFEFARQRGYYEWPRNVSTRELAEEMDISKTTLLEHLRKAESKLLDP